MAIISLPENGVEGERLHVMVGEEIFAQRGIMGCEHVLAVLSCSARNKGVALRLMQTLRIARNSAQEGWQWPSVRNSSPDWLYWLTTGSKRQ